MKKILGILVAAVLAMLCLSGCRDNFQPVEAGKETETVQSFMSAAEAGGTLPGYQLKAEIDVPGMVTFSADLKITGADKFTEENYDSLAFSGKIGMALTVMSQSISADCNVYLKDKTVYADGTSKMAGVETGVKGYLPFDELLDGLDMTGGMGAGSNPFADRAAESTDPSFGEALDTFFESATKVEVSGNEGEARKLRVTFTMSKEGLSADGTLILGVDKEQRVNLFELALTGVKSADESAAEEAAEIKVCKISFTSFNGKINFPSFDGYDAKLDSLL